MSVRHSVMAHSTARKLDFAIIGVLIYSGRWLEPRSTRSNNWPSPRLVPAAATAGTVRRRRVAASRFRHASHA